MQKHRWDAAGFVRGAVKEMSNVDDNRIRVLIVDDSIVVRLMLQQLIREDPSLVVAGAESSGQAALDKLDALRPDVVILDVEMPGLNGVETAAAIRARAPRLPVIMFSSHTVDGASVTIEALSRGAADFVTKPSGTTSAEAAMTVVREQLLPKVKALGNVRHRSFSATTRTGPAVVPTPTAAPRPAPFANPTSVANPTAGASSPAAAGPAVAFRRSSIELVCIATSTGGPEALETVLTGLPASFPVPIAIVQHMPPFFTKQLARRLSDKCAIRVREAESGEVLEPGTALIAPGDFHLQVRRRNSRCHAVTTTDPPENSCRPAADVLFRSAAAEFGNQMFAVVLTGMGQDGLKGCEAVRNSGGSVVVQDEATSVIWGMPGAVSRAGLASVELPITKIAAEIVRRVNSGTT
jgi:two-component system chemotaxis response regulator CheB